LLDDRLAGCSVDRQGLRVVGGVLGVMMVAAMVLETVPASAVTCLTAGGVPSQPFVMSNRCRPITIDPILAHIGLT
jgi:hypothetical protein